MRVAVVLALCGLLSGSRSRQGESPVGTYELTFQPRSEVMTATLTIARRDSGYRATIDMRQLHRPVTSDSVSVVDGRLRAYLPNETADLTFEFGIEKPRNDNFLVHFDDGDLRGPLAVERVKPKSAP
jgi:hypothetical protein